MATLETVSHRDALDIVFANRNRAYGAYQLRRAYPNYLGKAFALGLLLIGLMLVGPHILSAVSAAFPDQPQDATVCFIEIPDIDLTPPPPPPLPTPPPPVQSTIAFVPPVVEPDPLVQEEPPQTAMDDLQKSDAQIGDKTQDGTKDGPPIDIDFDPGPVVEPKKPEPEDPTYAMFDLNKPPTFPGGERELLKYLAENIKYPSLARENNIQGTVALQFVIGKDGSVSSVEILKDPGGGCGKEAIRVVQAMPKWAPGEANGHAVKVRFTLPVKFTLN